MADRKNILFGSVVIGAILVILLVTDQVPQEYRPVLVGSIVALILFNLYQFYRTYSVENYEASNEIIIYDSPPGFSKNNWTVPVGTNVTWRNAGDLDHTITSEDGLFNSGVLKRGSTYTVRFDKVGTFKYYCQEHNGWHKGTVEVTSAL